MTYHAPCYIDSLTSKRRCSFIAYFSSVISYIMELVILLFILFYYDEAIFTVGPILACLFAFRQRIQVGSSFLFSFWLCFLSMPRTRRKRSLEKIRKMMSEFVRGRVNEQKKNTGSYAHL
eukprot:Rmarinus@m.23300